MKDPIIPLKPMDPHSIFTIAQLFMFLVPTCSKSRNRPTRARSGFYQKGCCLFQLSVANWCADVFEELGLELQTVSSSSHLLIFFLRIFWSLWMYNLWCFCLPGDNECQWASWSRSLSFEKHLTEDLTYTTVILHSASSIHKPDGFKHLQNFPRSEILVKYSPSEAADLSLSP